MLHHTRLAAPGAVPGQWLLFLHGIFGSGKNWRTFAKRLVAARPEWGAVLVDLRMHGDSQDRPPPHTLASAAHDLHELAAAMPVAGVLGHSFGGKVALRWLADRPPGLREVWVIDSTPSARPDARGSEGTVAVLAALRGLPPRLPSREDFVARIVAQGFDLALAQWLALNLRPEEGGFRLALDLDAMDALLADYFRTDLWDVFCGPAGAPGGAHVHLVAGARSSVFSAEDRQRAARCAAAHPGQVTLSELPAGHFVHVDDPDGLLALMSGALG